MAILSSLLAFISANWKIILTFVSGMAISNFLQSIMKPQQADITTIIGSMMVPMMSMMFTIMFMTMFMRMFSEMIEKLGESI